MKKLILILPILLCLQLLGQTPKGKFLTDTIWVGKPVTFAFSYTHENKNDLIFPDSTYDFGSFQYIDIEYFDTQIFNKKLTDSVIYTLVSFEIDSVLSLKLPIKFYGKNKSVFSDESYIIRGKTAKNKDLLNPNLKTTFGYFNVPLDFNLPTLLYYLGVFIFTSLLIFVFFGNLIRRNYRKLLIFIKHRGYRRLFKKLMKKPKEVANISKALNLWKSEMEWTHLKPFTSMTTKEISETIKNERLNEALKEFDSALYANNITVHIPFAYKVLFDISRDSYRELQNNVK